jgi:lysophospholipase L1-like esterase
MQQILVYGDSLSWGIIPSTRERLSFHRRWPGVLEHGLCAKGEDIRVLEDCLNGRRTVFDDPFKPGRNGLVGLGQRIEMHSPLALVILMLGTNDFQSMHPHNAWHAAQGVGALVEAIRKAPIEPGMEVPPVMILVPPRIGRPKGGIAPKFLGGDEKCRGLAGTYREVALAMGCPFFDTGEVIGPSEVDGVHLDAGAHRMLGEALVSPVSGILDGDTRG